MSTDRLDVLHRMRPSSAVDDAWEAHDQEAVLRRVLVDTRPAEPTRRLRQRTARAGAIAAALAAAVAIPGVAVAVGDGLRPQSFAGVFSYWTDNAAPMHGEVAAGAAERVATVEGPGNSRFSVLRASNSAGTVCLAPVVESEDSAERRLPDLFTEGGSLCAAVGAQPGTNGAISVAATDSAVVWYGEQLGATHGQLIAADGSEYPVLVIDGYLFGWYPLAAAGDVTAPVLTLYGADDAMLQSGPIWEGPPNEARTSPPRR